MTKIGRIYYPSINSNTVANPMILNHMPLSSKVFHDEGVQFEYLDSLDKLANEYKTKRTNNEI